MAMVEERDKSDERSCPNGGGRRCVTSMMSARQHLATRPKLGRLLITHVSANTYGHTREPSKISMQGSFS